MQARSDVDLMLGDSLETILEEERKYIPRVTEYLFEHAVLDILENPFGRESLARYAQFVGELTKPLNVMDNQDQSKILFTVPALVQSPITTIPTARGMTADVFLKSLSRDMDLGGRHVNEKIRAFMMQMTHKPDYAQTVIVPIQQILARYNRKMIDLPGIEPVAPAVTPAQSTGTSSFSDEYDD